MEAPRAPRTATMGVPSDQPVLLPAALLGGLLALSLFLFFNDPVTDPSWELAVWVATGALIAVVSLRSVMRPYRGLPSHLAGGTLPKSVVMAERHRQGLARLTRKLFLASIAMSGEVVVVLGLRPLNPPLELTLLLLLSAALVWAALLGVLLIAAAGVGRFMP